MEVRDKIMNNNVITSLHIRGILYEDFVNYKYACLTIAMPYCDFKCNNECGEQVCQNANIVNGKIYTMDISTIVTNYLQNRMTKAIVFQGLEPFYQDENKDSFAEVEAFINYIRNVKHCNDDVIIYTGYTEGECYEKGYIQRLQAYSNSNIIIKFGRYQPNQAPHLDPILGVKLASDNQYAKII